MRRYRRIGAISRREVGGEGVAGRMFGGGKVDG